MPTAEDKTRERALKNAWFTSTHPRITARRERLNPGRCRRLATHFVFFAK